MIYRNDQHRQKATPAATTTDQQGQLNLLVHRFAAFVDAVEHSVGRAEEPHWRAVHLSAKIEPPGRAASD